MDTVARHRGATTADVLERMANGKIFIGTQAIEAGLVDGITTLQDLVSTLNKKHGVTVEPSASDNQPPTLAQRWERDPKLRDEFGGDFGCYEAYANRHEIQERLRH